MDLKKNLFFEVVKEGSVDKLQVILKQEGLEETTVLAESFNEFGETPLLLAITENNIEVVEFLIGTLNVPIDQFGKFRLGDDNSKYHEASPPLFCAITFNKGKIQKIVNLLIHKEKTSDKMAMAETLITLNSVLWYYLMDRKQKITTLELMGLPTY